MGGDAALLAADTAKKRHCAMDALLDIMESAETSYEQRHTYAGAGRPFPTLIHWLRFATWLACNQSAKFSVSHVLRQCISLPVDTEACLSLNGSRQSAAPTRLPEQMKVLFEKTGA